MTIMIWFNITVVVFTVANLMAGGLECDLKEALKWLRSPKLVVPTLLWGWVAGPALAWLIILVLPSVGGTCRRADVDQSGADRAVPAAGGVKSPRRHDLHRGLHPAGDRPHRRVDAGDGTAADQGIDLEHLAAGETTHHIGADSVADRHCDPVLQAGGGRQDIQAGQENRGHFPAALFGTTLWIYGKEMLGTVGSFATAAWVIFMVVMAVVPYLIGFGLKQNQRSVMAIGQSSRNISAGFVAFYGITNPPEGMFLMVLLVVPIHVIIGLLSLPPIFAKLAGKVETGGQAATSPGA